MKETLRKLFSPILNIFESGEGEYHYKPLNRTILIVIGVLFTGLSIAVVIMTPAGASYGYLLPVVIFLAAGLVCLIVGLLGNDRAVAKIWGNR